MSDESLHGLLTSEFAASAESEPNAEPVAEVEVQEHVTEPVEHQTESAEAKADRLRDEKGKFAKRPDEPVQTTAPNTVQQADPLPERPRTWKKDFLPLWDKVAKGEQLTADEGRKLAAYQTQRESEYQAGINQHKGVAQQAQHLTEALTPYIPVMQERGLNAPAFIKTLGDTYTFLVKGSPQQKLNALAQLANDVGIPLHAIAQTQGGQQVDPVVPQLLQQLQDLKSEVYGVKSWRDQQEIEAAQGIISKFMDTNLYPHFEQVRGTMGNLLLQGHAKTPEEAYAKAVRLNDEVWEAEQERQAQLRAPTPQANRSTTAAKAKADAVSPRSSAPSGMAGVVGSGEIADLLRRGFAQHNGRV